MGTPEGAYRYAVIDLKSFYASVECVDRGLDPLAADLVVADPSRGPSTICLAVSPHLKAQGCPSRPRVRDIPAGLTYQMARPRMRRYMEASAEVVSVYLGRLAPEDVHVYSVDECFLDLGPYLRLYHMTPRELAWSLTAEVRDRLGLHATVGLGTNLFLAKVALDLMAKHAEDMTGALDEESFRERVWRHRPITDVWGISTGTARRLARLGALDLLGVTRVQPCELRSEFGVRAGALLDHAWGRETLTMADLKAYRPVGSSISRGQVLFRDYELDDAMVVLREMCDSSVLELAARDQAATGVSAWCGYSYDSWGEDGPAGASGSRRLSAPTDSREALWAAVSTLLRERADPRRLVRRVGLSLTGLVSAAEAQGALFGPGARTERERALAGAQVAAISRFGRTAVFRGTSLRPCATGLARAEQVGGHHE